MSSTGTNLLVHGYFCLAGGTRVAVPKSKSKAIVTSPNAGSAVTYYMVYQTTLQCRLGDYMDAEIRVYSPPGDVPLPDDTVIDLEAKAWLSPNGTPTLDSLDIAPFPGDPSDPKYDSSIPDKPNSYLDIIGIVVSAAEDLGEGSRAFTVETSAHVNGQRRMSVVKCVYDGDNLRWRNTPVPPLRSAVHVLGFCRHITVEGNLAVSIVDITMNTGPLPTLGSTHTPDGPALKKKRFNAVSPTKRSTGSGHASSSGSKSTTASVIQSNGLEPASVNVPANIAPSSAPETPVPPPVVSAEAAEHTFMDDSPVGARARKGKARATN